MARRSICRCLRSPSLRSEHLPDDDCRELLRTSGLPDWGLHDGRIFLQPPVRGADRRWQQDPHDPSRPPPSCAPARALAAVSRACGPPTASRSSPDPLCLKVEPIRAGDGPAKARSAWSRSTACPWKMCMIFARLRDGFESLADHVAASGSCHTGCCANSGA